MDAAVNPWPEKDHGPLHRCLVRFSCCCAFLSVVLISFDIFPYRLIGGFHPRLPYMISLPGMLCYLLSLRWTGLPRRHRGLTALAAVFALYGLLSTLLNASLGHEQNLVLFSLLNYLERQAAPVGFMLWFAFLLSAMPDCKARKFFITALLLMFFSNAIHMILELAANHGAAGIKDLLIRCNPWFRLENVYWGNWPPPYYKNRVRGLFGEPAHLAYAFIPVLAFFLYKLQDGSLKGTSKNQDFCSLARKASFDKGEYIQHIRLLGEASLTQPGGKKTIFRGALKKNILYALPLLLVFVSYGGVLPTGTGVLGLGFLALAFAVHVSRGRRWGTRLFSLWRRCPALSGHGASLAVVLVLSHLLAAGGVLYTMRDHIPAYAAEWRVLDSVAEYCARAQTEPGTPPPDLEKTAFSRFFFRALSTRLEWDIALRHPFGIGYQLSGLYRKPLAVFEREDLVNQLRVRRALAQDEPVPVFPYFCEYTALAAELGFIGLLLFLALCLYAGLRAYRRYTATGDVFILYMLFALPAFMLTLLAFALRSGHMFYYFLGFLYALGSDRK